MSLRMTLRAPVIVLVLAFTAVPIELRPIPPAVFDLLRLRLNVQDIVLNVVGFVPIGFVLAGCRPWSMLAAALAISGLAEGSQLFTVGRAPSLIDLATNVIGASIGWLVAERLALRSLSIGVGRKVAITAAALAVVHFAIGARYVPREFEEVAAGLLASRSAVRSPVSDRGTTAPGGLEGAWAFEENTTGVIRDVSGNGLDGTLVGGARVIAGSSGGALVLNGSSQHLELGDPTALRLTGSMTVSAWLSARASSSQEAVVVSRRGRFGYQLDTATFRGPASGPRTIAFRLTNATGRLMVRFGRTPLETNRWYHVAGVYDASAQTLSVYLDGRLDNGCLLGDVTSSQLISESPVLVGRNGRRSGSWFRGALDDVRIYSRALTPVEIDRERHASRRAQSLVSAPSGMIAYPDGDERACMARPPDARVAGLFVAFGLLVGIACAGLWRSPAFRVPGIAMSLAAGFLLGPSVPATLPDYYRHLIPVLTMVGGAAAVLSMRRRSESSRGR